MTKFHHKLHGGSCNLATENRNNHMITDDIFKDRIGGHVTTSDIKWQEDQLQYQAILMDNVSDIIVTTDNAFRIKSFNKAAELCYGYKEKEVLGKLISNIVQFDYPYTTIEDAFAELKQKGIWKGEVSFVNKQGELKHFLHTVKFVHDKEGNTIGVMSIGRDITERKQAEEKLQQSELFYRNLIANALDGILLTDAQGNINFTSLSVKHILGYETEEVIGKNCFQFVHPDDQVCAADSFQREVVEDPEIKFIVIRLLKKDGEWLWCMVRGHNLLHNFHVQGIVIYFHDDTLRKKATDALKESEQRFRNLVRNLQFGVVMQNSEGKIMMCNEALLQIFQLKEEEIIGRSILDTLDDAIHEDGTAVRYEELPLIRALTTKKPARNVVMGIYHPRLKERRWILVNSDPILDENNNLLHVICSINDISERKKLEQKLIHEQTARHKLLTQATIDGQEKERREIGKELHDNIGQQLTTTKLYLDLAKSTADERTTEMISLALKNVSAVINEVRSISRSLVPPALGDLGLIESVYDLVDTLSMTQALHVELEVSSFKEEAVPENQKLMLFRIIQEQLNNIVKHAQASCISIMLKHTEHQLYLEIKDNGKGFNVTTVRKGIGLSNIRSRAELLGGRAEVISSAGAGCTLVVAIPRG
ncbi:MAG: PAS domain S-box protein [Flavisolibacter sp.]|nr:PAS domain S-box protein [Flavisolibacter sp.]